MAARRFMVTGHNFSGTMSEALYVRAVLDDSEAGRLGSSRALLYLASSLMRRRKIEQGDVALVQRTKDAHAARGFPEL